MIKKILKGFGIYFIIALMVSFGCSFAFFKWLNKINVEFIDGNEPSILLLKENFVISDPGAKAFFQNKIDEFKAALMRQEKRINDEIELKEKLQRNNLKYTLRDDTWDGTVCSEIRHYVDNTYNYGDIVKAKRQYKIFHRAFSECKDFFDLNPPIYKSKR
jgi:hypothetical protein